MNETRPTNHTPAIALGVAALLLLVVAGMSYKDYVRKSLEKEFEEKANRAGYGQQQQGYPQQGNPAYNPNYAQQQQQQYAPNQRPNQFPAAQPQQQPAAPAQQYDPARLPRETNLQAPRDPEVTRLEENLAKVRAQAAETEKRYNDLTRKMEDQPAPAPAPANDPSRLSPELQNALINPPGGNPEITESITRMKKQVLASPSIGRIISYDVKWGIVTFGAGAGQGVKKNQRFAVRRGSDLLGWVKVDEVHQNMSIAHMVTKNADSDMTLKPQPGDDLIQFEL